MFKERVKTPHVMEMTTLIGLILTYKILELLKELLD